MDFRQIIYFMSVYDAGSFTKASQNEHVAQPALSMQIARLEKDLNVALFDRHANGVTPTLAGRRFYDICHHIVQTVSSAKAEMAAFANSVSGKLTIGLPPSACRTVVGQCLPQFADTYPNVEIIIHEAFSGTLNQWVLDGTVDFAFASRPQNDAGLAYRLMHSEPLVLASNAPEFGDMLQPVDLLSVRSLKLITPLPHHEISRAVLRHLKVLGIRVERVMYLDGYTATIEMLRNSNWSTVTALSVVFREIEANTINVHPLLGSGLTYDLCLVHGLNTTLSPAAEGFVNLMQQAFLAYTDRYRKVLNNRPGLP